MLETVFDREPAFYGGLATNLSSVNAHIIQAKFPMETVTSVSTPIRKDVMFQRPEGCSLSDSNT